MRYPWIDGYLMRKNGVTKDLQPEWNWIRYHVGGKMFAAVLLDRENKPYYINLKLKPAEGEFLRGQYPDILPGYYSNKQHWNSVKADGAVPEKLLRRLLDESYFLVLASFPKEKQRQIAGVSVCGTDCAACPLLGDPCQGCTALKGRVFHAPAGKPCPIYGCAVGKKCLASCAACREQPCEIWLRTRDPHYTDEEFRRTVEERTARLRERYPQE